MVLEARHREKIKSFVASSPDSFRSNNKISCCCSSSSSSTCSSFVRNEDDSISCTSESKKEVDDVRKANNNNHNYNMKSSADESITEDSLAAKEALKGLEELKLRRECEILQKRVLSCPLDIIAGNDDIVNTLLSLLNQQLQSTNISQSIDDECANSTPLQKVNESNQSSEKEMFQLSTKNSNRMKMFMSEMFGGSKWMINLVLTVLFGTYVLSYCLLDIHDSYVSPMIQASKWRGIDEDRLSQEFTYYNRHCDASDLTATNLDQLLSSPPNPIHNNNNNHLHSSSSTIRSSSNSSSHNNSHGISQQMMRHGMTVLPSPVMTDETMDQLRSFILERNDHLTRDEAIPLDGAYNRWSFGIGANEHPSVVQALKEVSSSTDLTDALQILLGDANPAVVEITAITAAHGASFQGFHADVKPLASAVKYSRTFTHSYSLFVPLQDTSPAMGATELCPGTHYCTNDLTDVCERYGFQASSSSQLWKKGHALLLNQCAWHRGYPHTDPHAPKRVVFILTFISRPKPGTGDYRQLSHGTYFHIRWDMYGHTLFDLRNPDKVMAAPFSILRSFGLWKPWRSMWGWDWITTSCLRIANFENGYQFDDLYDFVYRQNTFGIPFFLQGDVLADNDYDNNNNNPWQVFIQQTLQRFTIFTKYLNAAVISVYLLYNLIIAIPERNPLYHLSSSLLRLFLWSSFIAIPAYHQMYYLNQSPWAQSIRRGTLYARPFPSAQENKRRTNLGIMMINDESSFQVPKKNDVLIGTRFDSRYIGIYNQFLDYHPGNYQWLKFLDEHNSQLYHPLSYKEHYNDDYNDDSEIVMRQSTVFQRHIIENMLQSHDEASSSFLKQDTITGKWYKLSAEEIKAYTILTVILRNNPFLSIMDQEISFLVAEVQYEFPYRNSGPLRDMSLTYLSLWRKLFLDSVMMTTTSLSSQWQPKLGSSLAQGLPKTIDDDFINVQKSSQMLYCVVSKSSIKADLSYASETRVSPLLKNYVNYHNDKNYYEEFNEHGEEHDDDEQFIIPFEQNDFVEVNHKGQGFWYAARINQVLQNDYFEVRYDSDGLTDITSVDFIREHTGPFQQGEIVSVESSIEGNTFSTGTIIGVYPNVLAVDILHSNNTVEQNVDVSRLGRVQ